MNASTNNVVRALASLCGHRMGDVHAALVQINPAVVAQEGEVVLPMGEGLRRVVNELSKLPTGDEKEE